MKHREETPSTLREQMACVLYGCRLEVRVVELDEIGNWQASVCLLLRNASGCGIRRGVDASPEPGRSRSNNYPLGHSRFFLTDLYGVFPTASFHGLE